MSSLTTGKSSCLTEGRLSEYAELQRLAQERPHDVVSRVSGKLLSVGRNTGSITIVLCEYIP
jgi:hypothetical protein